MASAPAVFMQSSSSLIHSTQMDAWRAQVSMSMVPGAAIEWEGMTYRLWKLLEEPLVDLPQLVRLATVLCHQPKP